MDRREFCYSAFALAAASTSAARLAVAGASPNRSLTWDSRGRIQLVLEDLLEHPFYWWPRTLLSYPIRFDQPADLARLQLTRTDTGEQIPIQFSDVHNDSATLNFFSDLPSGARREFVLSTALQTATLKPQVTETIDGDTIILDSGMMRVRIPSTQDVHGIAPGPIMQLSRGGAWFGSSALAFDGETITRITSTRVESGPLLIAYEIAYDITGRSRYVARVQCNAKMEFVRFQEDMEAMQPGVRGLFTSDLTNFDVTHRQAPNHPYPFVPELVPYEQYPWEKIDDPFFSLFDTEPLPKGQLPFSLGVYQTWTAVHTGTSANFWNEKTGDALGIFIDRPEEWQDHEYANHVEGVTQQVRYVHLDGKFVVQWPISRGTRSMCIACYDHELDKKAMLALDRAGKIVQKDGHTYKVVRAFTSHTMFLQNRHNTLDLNQLKDWVLEYPKTSRSSPAVFKMGHYKNADELENDIMNSEYVGCLPMLGTRENGGQGAGGIVNFGPVPSRRIQARWVDGFNRLSPTMTERQRRRLVAMYLLVAYVHAGNDFMPLVPMLSGHPNYIADVKSTPAAMAFLFPDHPMASSWADLWEKAVEINTRYNTRPNVKNWDAIGGRWTENLGTYVWAFLRPSLMTEYLMRRFDGQERFLSSHLAAVADWLVNSLTAPFDGETAAAYSRVAGLDGGHEWGVLAPGKGPRRIHPPQGAHAERRVPPRSFWYLGTCLQNYAPMVAEHAMWAARPDDQDMEMKLNQADTWDVMYEGKQENTGTNPRLKSRKMTGYGVVLRAAVDTPQEISIHLQQIDQGPNYRWGRSSDGGCGVIYFSAKGKAYSMNGAEDVGDRWDQDTDFCSNFGVYKDGSFRSIGMNVLSRPFYNLGAGQFAELTSRHDKTAYSAPEYVSRSLLLAGHDYFLVYDALLDQSLQHRLSWFVRRGDELPTIQLIRGGKGDPRTTQKTELQTAATTGVWFDAAGDSMALVSHRKDIEAKATPYGCRVRAEGMDDLVFFTRNPVSFDENGNVFTGTAGLIRIASGKTEFALFHGSRIGVDGMIFITPEPDLGISGSIAAGQARGEYYAPQPSSMKITSANINSRTIFYIDGKAVTSRREVSGMLIDLDAGLHHWELTETLPVPVAPHILRTESHAGGARIVIAPVAAATQYRLDRSEDGGSTWSKGTIASQPEIELNGLKDAQKIHVRAVALNALHESLPGPDYPLYGTNRAPAAPDGLRVALAQGEATLTWGEVLGVREYKLYSRAKNTKTFHLLYQGPDRSYLDRRPEIQPANRVPGERKVNANPPITEYCVTASNRIGEGPKSRIADSDPASWRNWDPMPGEPFRRVESFDPASPPSSSEWARYYPS